MDTQQSTSTLTARVFVFLALISSVLIGYLNTRLPSFSGANTPLSYYFLLITWIAYASALFALSYSEKAPLLRLILGSLIASFIASLPWYWTYNGPLSSQYFLTSLAMYAITAFHVHYQKKQWQWDYPTLFQAVWDTAARFIIAWIFLGLCWILLLLCSELFSVIGITLIKQLIRERAFDAGISNFFLIMGLYITTQTDNAVRQVRLILLFICRYLFIALAFIGIFFMIAFFTTLHQSHLTTVSDAIFSSIAFLCVIFLNGVYQDGSDTTPYPTGLMWVCRIFLWVTPIFTLMALHTLKFDRIDTGNFSYFLFLILLCLYNVTYAVIAMGRQKAWLKPIEHSNFVLAVILIAVTLLTTNPAFTQKLKSPLPPQTQTHYRPAPATVILPPQPSAPNIPKDEGTWLTLTGQTIPQNAFVAGENQGPLYVCKTKVNEVLQAGVATEGKCTVVINGKIISSNTYTVYAEPSRKVYWSTYYPLADGSKRVDVSSSSVDRAYVCRTIYNNRVSVGIYRNGVCTFVANDAVVNSQDIPQYLYLNNQ